MPKPFVPVEPYIPGTWGAPHAPENRPQVWSGFFDKSADLETYEQFNEALKAKAAATLGVAPKKMRTALRKVSNEITASVYETPGGARRLAERVRAGVFGKHMSWVYFIGQGTDGPIKIGKAENPKRRLIMLQTSCPEVLTLLGVTHGDYAAEAVLHGAFAPDHIRGEWFRRSPQLLEFIRVINLKVTRVRGVRG